jgi:vancomycin permeability regulator SanA
LKKRGILKKDLVIDDKALDTVGEIELSLPKVSKAQKIAVLSDSEHLKRVKILYRNRGIKPEFLAAEDILGEKKSPNFFLKLREVFLRTWLFFDKNGIFVNKLASFLRK